MRITGFFAVAALSAFLAGCGSSQAPAPSAADARQVRIDWLGNQCFRISSSIGTSILTNPFGSGLGGGRSLPSPLKPDVILITQERPDSNNVDAADNQPTIFRGSVGMGLVNASGIRIRGVATFRDPENQTPEGMNLVYSWSMDGIRFCFLGWLAHPLSPYQLAQIGTVDVLFVPVGGPLSPSDRATVLSQLRPRVVIPMGVGARGWTTGRVESVSGNSVLLSRPQLPLQLTTLLFGS